MQSGQKTKLHVLCHTKRSKAPRYCITDQIRMKFNAGQQEKPVGTVQTTRECSAYMCNLCAMQKNECYAQIMTPFHF
jgi:hypothetical protein